MKIEKLSSENVNANSVNTVLTAGNFKPILFSTPMVQAILRGEKSWDENPFVWVYEFERTDVSYAHR